MVNKIINDNGIFKIKINPKNYKGKITNNTFKEIETVIEEFANTMIKNNEYVRLCNFIKRLKTTRFIYYKEPFIKEEFNENIVLNGYYSSHNNTITFSDYESLTHELFHLSNQHNNLNNIERGGLEFNPNEPNINIGIGINEGLVELYHSRYFPKKEVDTYYNEKMITKHIELLIGENNLKRIFSREEYFELLIELSKYSSVEETLTFLDSIDSITKSNIFGMDKVDLNTYLIVNDAFAYISKYLKKCYKKKIEIENLDKDSIYITEDMIPVLTYKSLRVVKPPKVKKIIYKKGINQ
jgi:hypothetical protein